MTLFQAIKAYEACLQLQNEKTNMQTAYGIAQLMHRLEEHARFYAREELKILTDCGESEDGKPVAADGKVRLRKPEEYARRMQELNSVEVDAPEKVTLRLAQISAAQVMALEDVAQLE